MGMTTARAYHYLRWHAWTLAFALTNAVAITIFLPECGAASDPPLSSMTLQSHARSSAFQVAHTRQGVTPFIALVDLLGQDGENVSGVEFTVAPKPESASKPVHVRYSFEVLTREGNVAEQNRLITLPVFGLYAGFTNQVMIEVNFRDGSTAHLPLVIATPAYIDPNGIYDHPTIVRKRATDTSLGFGFFVIKSNLGSPVIVDTDAEIRWVGAGVSSAFSSWFDGNAFIIGEQSSPIVHRLGLDGALNEHTLPQDVYIKFHHNIDAGKIALLAEVNDHHDGVSNIETTLIEIDADARIKHRWDLANIISTYMRRQGDDPTAFVRPGVDWFHMNASTYDPHDDSIIVSSRENFLIKIDYSTGNIIWILGDPTKYWYTFPSLRAKALTLHRGGLYPIGQHAVSITSDGLVMVFNDGYPSTNQPAGTPEGASRSYSTVSAYSIDREKSAAKEAWRFDYEQSIFSPFCGSAYQTSDGSLLVDYALADNRTEARLVGLDAAHEVIFDFGYPTSGCATSWNAMPIALDDLRISSPTQRRE